MAENESRLKSNIHKLYAFSFFQTFLVIIPVIVPFWQGKGLSLQDVFTLQGIFGGVLIALDLPAGYVADLIGRKKTLVVGSIVSALGFQILWFGQTFTHFVFYEIILALGLSLQSGCDVALLYNSLEKLGRKGGTARYLGTRITSQTVGEGIASLLGGVLAGISLQWPAYANAMTAWLPVVIALSLYEPPGQTLSAASHKDNFKLITKALFGHSKLLTLVIVNLIFYGFATYCAVWSFQPYWGSLGLSYSAFGYLWALNSFAVAFVSRIAHWVERKVGGTVVVSFLALLPIIGYWGAGTTGGLWGLVFTLAFPMCRGLAWVVLPDAINVRVPAEVRATTNSVGSLGMRALFLIFGPMIGRLLETRGPQPTMVALGWIYFFGLFLVALPLLSLRKQFVTR